MPEAISNCPICNNHTFHHFLRCSDYTTTKEEFNIIRCSECSFLITSPRPSQSEIGKYYQSDKYISHTGSSKNLTDKLYLLARSYSLSKKRHLIERHLKPGTLLDYGSGTGEFLNHCSIHGWKVEGVEPSQEAKSKAKQFAHLIIHSDLEELTNRKFQVITLWHVLEHIHTLTDTLKRLTELLHEKGKIIIAVPNPESYDAKKYQQYWAAYDVPRHLWHFKKKDISALLKQSGLTLVDIQPMKLDSFYVSLLSESYKHGTRYRLRQLISAFFNGLTSNRKAKLEMNYSSLIYIAEK
jgi:2-polyprenyl-3-methyl-5-hydroxy-6-metoxy-1,4-benzoquinol methylase